MSNRASGLLFAILAVGGCEPQGESPRDPGNARNVILFIGDGMGVSTVTAARIFDGQSKGGSGEEHELAFERFPNVALVKTYNTNRQVPDSAGTATAMMTGQKTRAGLINVGAASRRRSCAGALDNPLTTIAERARNRGVAVGVVTTTRLTHATPATVYARSPERDWEDDRFLAEEDWQLGCRDIAYQLVHMAPGSGLDVAMGGGSQQFFGSEHDGLRKSPSDDLVRDWLSAAPNRRYINSADQLASLGPGDQVLGLFARSHPAYMAEKKDSSTEPTLSEMTTAAITLLDANDAGYFLMVEGGRIDHGHHDGRAGYALTETQAFSEAIEAALSMVDLTETLVLVTADHSHVFTIGGYVTRGNPILGLVVKNDTQGEPQPEPDLAADGQPYTTLAYANGRGAVTEMPRPTPGTGIDAMQQALTPVIARNIDGSTDLDETHGGEDVALYAIGAGADAAHGVIEQNRIYDIMVSAYGWTATR